MQITSEDLFNEFCQSTNTTEFSDEELVSHYKNYVDSRELTTIKLADERMIEMNKVQYKYMLNMALISVQQYDGGDIMKRIL